jgi:enoyl-CoA hydratase/carnithine racemase
MPTPTEHGREVCPGTGIHLNLEDRIATLHIARGDVGNTLTSAAFHGIAEALRQVEDNPSAAALVLRSDAEVFCSGGSYLDPGDPTRPSPHYAARLTQCYDRWVNRTFPVAAIVNGAAHAFGCAMALTSDVVIATRAASFQLPEMLGGVVPSFAISTLLTQYPAGFVAKLALGCRALSPAEALHQGAVNHVTDTLDAADQALASYLRQWRTVDPATLRAARTAVTTMSAADGSTSRALAITGVEEQLTRYRSGAAHQRYLSQH